MYGFVYIDVIPADIDRKGDQAWQETIAKINAVGNN